MMFLSFLGLLYAPMNFDTLHPNERKKEGLLPERINHPALDTTNKIEKQNSSTICHSDIATHPKG